MRLEKRFRFRKITQIFICLFVCSQLGLDAFARATCSGELRSSEVNQFVGRNPLLNSNTKLFYSLHKDLLESFDAGAFQRPSNSENIWVSSIVHLPESRRRVNEGDPTAQLTLIDEDKIRHTNRGIVENIDGKENLTASRRRRFGPGDPEAIIRELVNFDVSLASNVTLLDMNRQDKVIFNKFVVAGVYYRVNLITEYLSNRTSSEISKDSYLEFIRNSLDQDLNKKFLFAATLTILINSDTADFEFRKLLEVESELFTESTEDGDARNIEINHQTLIRSQRVLQSLLEMPVN